MPKAKGFRVWVTRLVGFGLPSLADGTVIPLYPQFVVVEDADAARDVPYVVIVEEGKPSEE